MTKKSKTTSKFIIQRNDLNQLFEALSKDGYKIIGPAAKNGVIKYDELKTPDDLPEGYADKVDHALYRIEKTDSKALFNYNVGAHTWKRFLFPPHHKLYSVTKGENQLHFTPNKDKVEKVALLGVRACELEAIKIQDRILAEDKFVDAQYVEQRKNSLIIAVNCTTANNNCFCTSMNTGPKAGVGFDLCLTEVIESKKHYFIIEAGSKAGQKILKDLALTEADETADTTIDEIIKQTVKKISKKVDTTYAKAALQENINHIHYDNVAKRCTSCGNCRMVCPTCFCTTVEERTSLDSNTAERVRIWDSCFSKDFTHIHGGSARPSTRSHYRQWLTHKFANWVDQFGMFGCVGCGRCITWCPLGIDITEEVTAITDDVASKFEERAHTHENA